MSSYTNPHTQGRYRLARLDAHSWRITKSTTDRDGNIKLYHLWGFDGDPRGGVDGEPVDGVPRDGVPRDGVPRDGLPIGDGDPRHGVPSARSEPRSGEGTRGESSVHEFIPLPHGIDLLVRGRIQRNQRIIGNGESVFVSVTLTDMDRTFDFICAGIKEAVIRYERGAPGFRAQSPVLRQEKDRWIQAALDAPLAFARWWREMEYQANPEPKWLKEALEIVDRNAKEISELQADPELAEERRRAVG